MKNHKLEPRVWGNDQVLRIHVGGDVAIDLYANAALRWLCRADFAPRLRIVGVSR